MLRKISVLLAVFMVCFTFLIPLHGVFAANDIDVISGKFGSRTVGGAAQTDGAVSPNQLSNVTDNNSSTFIKLHSGVPSAYYDLGDVYNISSYGFNAYGEGSNIQMRVTFYDSAKNVIHSTSDIAVSANSYSRYGSTVSLSGVRYVGISNVYPNIAVAYVHTLNVYTTQVIAGDITNLNHVSGVNDVSFTWTNPVESSFSGVKVYQNGSLISTLDKTVTSYTSVGLNANTSYVYKFTTLDSSGTESSGVTKTVMTNVDPQTVPPANVTNLSTTAIEWDRVVLNWTNPSDADLAGVKVYKGSELIASTGIVTNYAVDGLNPETAYTFKVIPYDTDGNLGAASILNVTTAAYVDTEAPAVPANVSVSSGSNSLHVSWKANVEPDIAGYNVYLNGEKINSGLVKNSFYTITSLTNDAHYSVTVSAVDKAGNESNQTAVIDGVPVGSAVPIIDTDYDLVDVVDGIQKLFSSYWLLVAFSVSIPLSFYIAARLKLMFFP